LAAAVGPRADPAQQIAQSFEVVRLEVLGYAAYRDLDLLAAEHLYQG
jgi:hypothetical protein